VALPAFARHTPLLLSSNRSLSPARRFHSSKHPAAGLMLWVHVGRDKRTDGWTDRRTSDRFIDSAPHYAGSANKRHISKEIELDMFGIAKVNNT